VPIQGSESHGAEAFPGARWAADAAEALERCPTTGCRC
jgi:hypothetical protein